MVLDGWDDVMAGPRPTNSRFLKGLSVNTSGNHLIFNLIIYIFFLKNYLIKNFRFEFSI